MKLFGVKQRAFETLEKSEAGDRASAIFDYFIHVFVPQDVIWLIPVTDVIALVSFISAYVCHRPYRA